MMRDRLDAEGNDDFAKRGPKMQRSGWGKVITDLRLKQDLTLPEAALMQRMPATTLSAYERGQRGMTVQIADRILHVYGMKLTVTKRDT